MRINVVTRLRLFSLFILVHVDLPSILLLGKISPIIFVFRIEVPLLKAALPSRKIGRNLKIYVILFLPIETKFVHVACRLVSILIFILISMGMLTNSLDKLLILPLEIVIFLLVVDKMLIHIISQLLQELFFIVQLLSERLDLFQILGTELVLPLELI